MTSPYILPDGNVQIAFSGGRTSAYMLHRIMEANGGLTAEKQDEMEGAMMQKVIDRAIAAFLIGGAGGGWIALVRVAVWGW